ncbi:MAG: hypothetical protein ABR573_07295 [Candidatus Dormibacteria bacterium]
MSLSTTVGGYSVVEYAGTLALTPNGSRVTLRHAGIGAGCGILGVAICVLTNHFDQLQLLGGMALMGGLFCLSSALMATLLSAKDPVGWEVSPGSITRKTMVLDRFRPHEQRFRVEQLELAHEEWVQGWPRLGTAPNGCTDLLRFWTREAGFVVIECEKVDRTLPKQGGAGGVGSAEMTPSPPTGLAFAPLEPLKVVGKTEVWTGPASVPPPILLLAQLIEQALCRPLVIVVGTCNKPSDD